jgi:chitin synthase
VHWPPSNGGYFVDDKATAFARIWAIYENGIYDLSDYFNTIQYYSTSSGAGVPNYNFLNENMTTLFKQQPGGDITNKMNAVFAGMSADDVNKQMTCLKNAFFLGTTDFRQTARCTVQNYLLLAFSILLMSTILAKCEWC